MPINNSKLNKSVPQSIEATEPIAPSSILQAAKLRQQQELADLQTQVDGLAEEFANRAAAIVEAGLQNSYKLARQKIGAIDVSFFDAGELTPVTTYALPDGETP